MAKEAAASFPDEAGREGEREAFILRVRRLVLEDQELLELIRGVPSLSAAIARYPAEINYITSRPAFRRILADAAPSVARTLYRFPGLFLTLQQNNEAALIFETSPMVRELIFRGDWFAKAVMTNPAAAEIAHRMPEVSGRIDYHEMFELFENEFASRAVLEGGQIFLEALASARSVYDGLVAQESALWLAVARHETLLGLLVRGKVQVEKLASAGGGVLAVALADHKPQLEVAQYVGLIMDNGAWLAHLRENTELRDVVFGSVDVLRLVLSAPGIVTVLARDMEVARLLASQPEVRDLVKSHPDEMAKVLGAAQGRQVVATRPALRAKLRNVPRLARALAAQPDLIGAMWQTPGLVGEAEKPAWRAVARQPSLARALRPAMLRNLLLRPRLMNELAARAFAGLTPEQWVGLMMNTGLLGLLNERPVGRAPSLASRGRWTRPLLTHGWRAEGRNRSGDRPAVRRRETVARSPGRGAGAGARAAAAGRGAPRPLAKAPARPAGTGRTCLAGPGGAAHGAPASDHGA